MATEGSRSASSSADSYIGSLISLTSKSEIRYEGILYNINTEESSIGLRNVRSFGTEGRKKDGPQLMPSDKVYEYILFRGSDIKDLQVKSSMPAQPTQPINGDPAIIQSHYPRPPPLHSSTLPTAANSSVPDPNIQNPQTGQTGPLLQSGPPLYPPGGNLGSWGPMPPHPNPNSTGLPMPPMYWPGFYAPPNGLPQLHQQSLLRPPPMQYPNYNANLPNGPPSMDTLPSLMQNKLPNSVGPNDVNLNIPNKPSGPSDVPPPPYLVTPGELLQSGLTTTGPVSSQSAEMVHKEVKVVQVPPTPYLITPGELVQSGLTMGPVSSQSAETVHKEVEAVQVEPAPESEQSAPVLVPVLTEAQPPILPLPPQQRVAPKTNGAPYQNRQSYNYRGRERGRGCGGPRSVMKFTEEFDFTAMNEKFNKDEIWGSLGKTNKDEEEYEDENDAEVDVKPVYSKDDFFDTLSCNSLDKQSSNGRPRFSEQMKLDTETFGEFSRHRGGRGGRGPNRGGRSRGGGGYYWRGGGGYNNSYGGRGARGGRVSNAAAREY